jgi:hypothetical protein
MFKPRLQFGLFDRAETAGVCRVRCVVVVFVSVASGSRLWTTVEVVPTGSFTVSLTVARVLVATFVQPEAATSAITAMHGMKSFFIRIEFLRVGNISPEIPFLSIP